jgi:hypothetical protein
MVRVYLRKVGYDGGDMLWQFRRNRHRECITAPIISIMVKVLPWFAPDLKFSTCKYLEISYIISLSELNYSIHLA